MFSWDQEEVGEGLRIVIIKNLFNAGDIQEDQQDTFFEELEDDLISECSKLGEITKITVSLESASIFQHVTLPIPTII